ncbi:UDP-glycosyltransferase UGT5-like [Ischnura elegans]|uniref:UDP-glycosyltransferase UGT5-like n=1 Tax=Ischnura elegans TaxID=197161 RepID=UPI001ED89778|nr:UDP-glycosyltransferase UGT5-like [Ischnura elegans]
MWRSGSFSGGCLPLFALGACLLLSAGGCEAARILGMFPFSSTSHRNVFGALTTELARRGHHVTIVTPHPIESPQGNFTQINVARAVAPHYSAYSQTKIIKVTDVLWRLHNTTTRTCEDVLDLPEMRQLMDPKSYGHGFDVLLTSALFSDCFYPFAHVYDVPIILFSPNGPLPNTDRIVGNLALPSFVPSLFLPFSDRMNFVERVVNFVSVLFYEYFFTYDLDPSFEEISRRFFGDHPPLFELRRRISLVLVNSHFAYGYPRTLTPNVVEVGGLHINPPKPLPKNLQMYMDEATDGVIYFSMGTNLKSVNFPDAKRNAILSAFSELRQRVIIKWEGDGPLPGQPPNVRLEKWVPQTDLLAHPSVKLFITHGGLLSFQEAVARGIPVIGIPFYGDQELNMKKVVQMRVGIRLSYTDLTKDTLLEAIKEALEDTSYRNNMQRLKEVAMDQPEHPLKRAVFWTEYVIRHKGAKHIQPASRDLPWYQLYSVDVALALASIPILSLLIVFCFLRALCSGRKYGIEEPTQKTKVKTKKQ